MPIVDNRIRAIKEFWDTRAREFRENPEGTLTEKYLRLLEIKTMTRFIREMKPTRLLDVGCANGYSTKVYARTFRHVNLIGMDYSEEMILHAQKDALSNCTFVVGDVLRKETFPSGAFDIIITQRCIQNLPDYTTQRTAIENMLTKKVRGGALLLMECSKDGVDKLNLWRWRLGKKPIENVEPWHNHFLVDKKLVEDFNARIFHFSSTYMFLAKVLHPRLSRLGKLLPSLGSFGYDKLYLIR